LLNPVPDGLGAAAIYTPTTILCYSEPRERDRKDWEVTILLEDK
jgi:hypothetical protein